MDKTTAIALLRGARTSVKAALGVPLGDADLNVIRALLHLDAALGACLPNPCTALPKQGIRNAGGFGQPPSVIRAEDCGPAYPQQTFDTLGARAWEYDPYRECVGRAVPKVATTPPNGEFTQPPNCSLGVSEPTPPMHAVALEMADSKVAAEQPEYQTLVGN